MKSKVAVILEFDQSKTSFCNQNYVSSY